MENGEGANGVFWALGPVWWGGGRGVMGDRADQGYGCGVARIGCGVTRPECGVTRLRCGV